METRRFGILLIIVLSSVQTVLVSSKSCERRSSCRCVFDDGSGEIDLTPISKSDGNALFQDLPSTSDTYMYSYNPCGAFTEISCVNVAACQYDQTNYVFYDIGVPDGVTFNYDGQNVVAQYTSQDGVRLSFVTLMCDPSLTTPKLDVTGETTTTQYYFTLTSSAACPIPYSNGLSGGSILLIVFFSLIGAYLLLGVSFTKLKQGATGKDIIPNIKFWSSLPGLIRDGCALTVGLICRRKTVYVSM